MSSSASESAIMNSPLHAPPKGQHSNFVNPESHGYILTDVCSVFLAVTTLLYAVRIYGRFFVSKRPRWDDLFCTIGFLLTIVVYILSIISVETAYNGYHSWDVTIGQLTESNFYLLSYLEGAACPAALGFIKLAFFFLYMQLFKPLRWIRSAIWIGAISSTVFYAAIVTLELYFATPRPGETFATHLASKLEGHEIKLTIPQAAVSVFFDFYILILPLCGIWNLQLNPKKKIAVSLVFLTGLMACLCSILTLYYRVALQTTDDILSLLVPTLITSIVEMQIGVVCSCAPTLGFLVIKVKEGTTRGSRNATKRSHTSSFARNQLSSNRLHNHYVSFDDGKCSGKSESLEDFEMGNTKSGAVQTVHTYIGGGGGHKRSVEEDAIHLTYDIRQQREPSRCEKVEGANMV